MVDNLNHLKILKGYKDQLFRTSDVKELQIWLDEVAGYFESSVFDSEIKNTEIISEINVFVVKYKNFENLNELNKEFTELVNSADDIIDKALEALTQ